MFKSRSFAMLFASSHPQRWQPESVPRDRWLGKVLSGARK